MFLWMLEEFTFILCHLCLDDRDGTLVLGYELLLLVHATGVSASEGRAAQAQPH